MRAIESDIPLPESRIWSLQDRFYSGIGPDAWKEEIVPQGTTANSYLADTYAAVAAAFCHDLARAGSVPPPLILEVGGGSGRFAWLLLNRLLNYHFKREEQQPAFNYLLTDGAESNIKNWQGKKRFRTLVDSGILDFGVLRVGESLRIETCSSGVLGNKELADRPIILVSNYLLGTIPCDLFRVVDHKLFRELISLHVTEEQCLDESIRSFSDMTARFTSKPIEKPYTGHAMIDAVLEEYRKLHGNSCIPVPAPSIRFIENFLKRKAPFLMLAADLGYTVPEAFRKSDPFIFDSYFAYYTNFHMIGEIFRRLGGSVQFQRFEDRLFSVGAFIHPGALKDLPETRRTARLSLDEFTPHDAYLVIKSFRRRVGKASFREIFSWLRFGRFDPLVAEACLPLLFDAIDEDDNGLNREQLHEMFMEAYQAYFPDGSEDTLDYRIAQLFLAARLDREALELMERSIPEFGRSPERLYVYALVLIRLGRKDEARGTLAEALELDSGFGPAQRLLEQSFGEAVDRPATPSHLRVNPTDNNSLRSALDIYDDAGAVIVEEVFPRPMIEGLCDAYMEGVKNQAHSSLGTPYKVGDKRLMIPVRMRPPFNDPALFANPFLMGFLKKLLGDKLIINSFGSVVAYPGAKSQHAHRDHPLLFDSDEVDGRLSTFAVTVLIPLIDLNEVNGNTQVWEGSHRWGRDDELKGKPTVGEIQPGGCLLFDYRLYHGGTPTLGKKARPVLYLVYSRPWFRDSKNFLRHPPLPISGEEMAAIPAEHRPLFRFGDKV